MHEYIFNITSDIRFIYPILLYSNHKLDLIFKLLLDVFKFQKLQACMENYFYITFCTLLVNSY